MAYDGPDQWIDNSVVPWGETDFNNPEQGKTDSIRKSWWGTNRFTGLAYQAAQATLDAVKALPAQVASAVVDAVAAKRWPYENQDGVPDEQKGTNNLFEATQASNGQVYRNAVKLDALTQAVADLSAKVDKLSGN